MADTVEHEERLRHSLLDLGRRLLNGGDVGHSTDVNSKAIARATGLHNVLKAIKITESIDGFHQCAITIEAPLTL